MSLLTDRSCANFEQILNQVSMRNLILSLVVCIIYGFQTTAQEIAPYIKIGETNETVQQASEKIINALKENSFRILGAYNPSDKSHLKVIAFTRTDLKNTVIKVKDRGALAAIFQDWFGSERRESGNVIYESGLYPTSIFRL